LLLNSILRARETPVTSTCSVVTAISVSHLYSR